MGDLCRSCDAEIVWAVLPSGKTIPLDAQPVPAGNVAAHRDAKGDLRARVLKDGEDLDEDRGERRGVSHFSSCPSAAVHRRGRT